MLDELSRVMNRRAWLKWLLAASAGFLASCAPKPPPAHLLAEPTVTKSEVTPTPAPVIRTVVPPPATAVPAGIQLSLITHAGEVEQSFFLRELETFVPDRVCDVHVHLWHPSSTSSLEPRGPGEDVTALAAYRQRMAELIPARCVVGGLLLPGNVGVRSGQSQAQNEMVSREVARDPGWRGAMLVSPDMDPEYVRQEVRRLGLQVLKCYHSQSERKPTWEAEVPEYLPEAHVRIAHEEGLCIVLHMVKARAVADPGNQYWIRHYCEHYPRMQLILAHAARGFNPYHAIEGLRTLQGLPNLWCDSAAVTEVGACEAVIDVLGADRLLYGTDFPISHMRGRCVAIEDGFVWLYENTLDWHTVSQQPLHPVFIGLEALRVLKQAAWHRHLSDTQVEGIFCGNAHRLLGMSDT
jgi:glutamate-1-semialdehyde 2,1-aminomutase